MPKFIDLTGQVFDRLTATKRVKRNKQGQAKWWCQCACGNVTQVLSQDIRTGHTKSCGCLSSRLSANSGNRTHGMRHSPEYNIWCKMISRCHNPNYPESCYYSERGISVCKEWRKSFLAFYNHIGKRPTSKHSIDRIDNNGNYEPGNVHWATSREQNNNRRNNHLVTLRYWTLTLAQWARFVGIDQRLLYYRIKNGWPPAKAIFRPIAKHK